MLDFPFDLELLYAFTVPDESPGVPNCEDEPTVIEVKGDSEGSGETFAPSDQMKCL